MKTPIKDFFTIPETETVHPEVIKNFKRNSFANLLDAAFWYFGGSFTAAYTIMPVFLSTLTDSPILIGLIPALEAIGWFLPQLFLAKYLEGINQRLPFVRRLGIFERLPFLLLAIGTFLIPGLDQKVALILILIIYTIKVFSSGLVALPWQELMATVIPVSHRGRYWGISQIVGRFIGLVGAFITGLILARIAYPNNYAIMFLIGFIAVSISFLFLSLNVEPVIERQSSHVDPGIWSRIKKILGKDKNFGIYLINRGFTFMFSMGMAFFTVYGIQKFNLPISQSATFTAVMFASEIVGSGIWGTLGDKAGYKRVIEFCNLISIIGLFSILFVGSVWGLFIVFGILSFAHSGEYISNQNFAMEFGSEKDRPTYIGMSGTLTGPFFLVAPIVGGSIIQLWGYKSMFLVALILATISFLIVKFLVKDPRTASDFHRS
ncbi:MAG: MFS transporter [Anaerolineales bacterium]